MEDYNAVARLWELAGLPHKPRGRDSRDSIREELKRGGAVFRVAEDQHGVLGAVFGTHDGRKGWINRLVVHPDHQRKGIASALVKAVESSLEEMGINIVACLVEDWNRTSRKFFTSVGYVPHDDIQYFSKRKHPDV